MEFSSLPSRLKAAYVCESKDDLLQFMENCRPLDLPYEVELIDTASPTHRACLSAFNIRQNATVEDLEGIARRYWKADGIVTPEIITLSPIRILRRL